MAAQQLTTSLSREYQRLYDSCQIHQERRAAVDAIVARLKANRARYEAVGKPLGIPWYVVAVIHTMETGIDFTRHLHNGDPLTARTVHVPAGRPPKGKPPFTWEQSAQDALACQGFTSWHDWSVPGVLYKLEAYNGCGYRKHPEVGFTPYLWSFSNHYTHGKYVADGKFSEAASSAQCGAAVLLRELQAGDSGPRTLELVTPHMTGPAVEQAQRLLNKNPFGSFDPGGIDGDYGGGTARAVKQAKWALGYPEAQVNEIFGPKLTEYLSGKTPLPADYEQRRKTRVKQHS